MIKMMLGTRIKNLAKMHGLSVTEVERMSGVGERQITRWDKNSPSFEKVLAVCDCLHITVEELLEREPVKDNRISEKYSALDDHGKKIVSNLLDSEYERCLSKEDKVVEIKYIRHYLSSPAAGTNGQVEGEDYEDIPRTSDCPGDADYCLTVNGDSMSPYIEDGSMVYVKRDAPLSDMDVGVFCVDGATYVKQYARSYDGSVYLLSANPKREDMNLMINRDSTIGLYYLGKVLLKKKLPSPTYEK